MDIHNTMEDYVANEVTKLYEQLKKNKVAWLKCDCEICRSDAICFVLNRAQPKYTVSERGFLHNAIDYDENAQLKTDITSLAIEGIKVINSSHRAYHDAIEKKQNDLIDLNNCVYNFPTIIGSVYDGASFEPLESVTIKLKIDGQLAPMYDATWANPAKTYKSTQGAFSFWPRPVRAKESNVRHVFSLIFEISADGYDPVTYAADLPLFSDESVKTTVDSSHTFSVNDIVLFKTGTESMMD